MTKFSELRPRDCFRFLNAARWQTPEMRALYMLSADIEKWPERDAITATLAYVLPPGWATAMPYFYKGCQDEPVELLRHFTTHPIPTPALAGDEYINRLVHSFLQVVNRPAELHDMFTELLVNSPDQKVYKEGSLRDDGKWYELKVTFEMTISDERPQPSPEAIEAIRSFVAERGKCD